MSAAVVYLILLVVFIGRAISALCDELVALVKLWIPLQQLFTKYGY